MQLKKKKKKQYKSCTRESNSSITILVNFTHFIVSVTI